MLIIHQCHVTPCVLRTYTIFPWVVWIVSICTEFSHCLLSDDIQLFIHLGQYWLNGVAISCYNPQSDLMLFERRSARQFAWVGLIVWIIAICLYRCLYVNFFLASSGLKCSLFSRSHSLTGHWYFHFTGSLLTFWEFGPFVTLSNIWCEDWHQNHHVGTISFVACDQTVSSQYWCQVLLMLINWGWMVCSIYNLNLSGFYGCSIWIHCQL